MLGIFGPLMVRVGLMILDKFVDNEELRKQLDDFKRSWNEKSIESIKLRKSAKEQRDRLKK